MKSFLVSLLLTFSLSKCFSQGNIISFPDCNLNAFCVDCDKVRAQLEKGISLTDYFLKRINPEAIKNMTGYLSIEVMADTSGKPCCRTIGNLTNATNDAIRNLHVAEIIRGMPLWMMKKNKKPKENNLIILEMKFSNQTLVVNYIMVEVSATPPWEK